jgi:hypothetical protein
MQESVTAPEEIDRLRQEVRRLKMELGNRETNFNRIFTTHQPVYLSQTTKQRTDLSQLLQQRGDVIATSRYYSAAIGRSPDHQAASAVKVLPAGALACHSS